MTELEKKIEGAERGICWPLWLKLHQVDVKNLDTGRKHQGAELQVEWQDKLELIWDASGTGGSGVDLED